MGLHTLPKNLLVWTLWSSVDLAALVLQHKHRNRLLEMYFEWIDELWAGSHSREGEKVVGEGFAYACKKCDESVRKKRGLCQSDN